MDDTTNLTQQIHEERRRQIVELGFTAGYDAATHDLGTLYEAGMHYCDESRGYIDSVRISGRPAYSRADLHGPTAGQIPRTWPLAPELWEPEPVDPHDPMTLEDAQRMYVKGAALLTAEYDALALMRDQGLIT